MRRLLALVLAAVSLQGAADTVHDDRGAPVTLAQPARRVITLSPHTTEMVFAAGGGARIVGTVVYSDFPEAAKSIPRVGDNQRFDLERVIALKPDLVVAWRHGTGARELEPLRKLGIPVFYSEPTKLEEIPATLRRLGRLLGSDDQAEQAALGFEKRLGELGARYMSRPQISVFFQVWDKPLYTLNGSSIVSDVLRLCGARNVFASLRMPAPVVSIEAVLLAQPDAIIAAQGGALSPNGLGHWESYRGLRAVRAGNLFSLDADLITRAGPRILEGAAQMCEQIERARGQIPARTKAREQR